MRLLMDRRANVVNHEIGDEFAGESERTTAKEKGDGDCYVYLLRPLVRLVKFTLSNNRLASRLFDQTIDSSTTYFNDQRYPPFKLF